MLPKNASLVLIHDIQVIPSLLWALLFEYTLASFVDCLDLVLVGLELVYLLLHVVAAWFEVEFEILEEDALDLGFQSLGFVYFVVRRLADTGYNFEDKIKQIHSLEVWHKLRVLIHDPSNYVQ